MGKEKILVPTYIKINKPTRMFGLSLFTSSEIRPDGGSMAMSIEEASVLAAVDSDFAHTGVGGYYVRVKDVKKALAKLKR